MSTATQQYTVFEGEIMRVGKIAAGEFFREIGDTLTWKVTIPGKRQMNGGRTYDAFCVTAVNKDGEEAVYSSNYEVRPVQFLITNHNNFPNEPEH